MKVNYFLIFFISKFINFNFFNQSNELTDLLEKMKSYLVFNEHNNDFNIKPDKHVDPK